MKKILLFISFFLFNSMAFSELKLNVNEVFDISQSKISLSDNMNFIVDVEFDKKTFKYHVFINTRVNSIVKFLSPKTEEGKKILINESNMWLFIPSGKNRIRISPQQRLVGSVSNIDVARVALDVEYRPHGISRVQNDSYLLELIAKKQDSMYSRVELLVDDNYYPKVATFFTKSGIASKEVRFEKYEAVGQKETSKLRVVKDLITNKEAKMIYSNFELKSIPNEYFQPDAFSFF